MNSNCVTPGKHTYNADLHKAGSRPDAVGCITHIGTLQVICDWPFKSQGIVSDLGIAR